MNKPNHIGKLCHFRLQYSQNKGKKISQRDKYIFRQIKKGDICIDCGANIGEISQLMVDRGAEVYAFEPDPYALKKLTQRFKGVGNIKIHNKAVSNKSGRLKLFFREEHDQDPVMFSVGSTLIDEKNDIDESKFCEVDVISLKEFIRQFEYIKILKLDIEGAECDILEDLLDSDDIFKFGLVLVETHEKWIPSQKERLAKIKETIKMKNVTNTYLNWT